MPWTLTTPVSAGDLDTTSYAEVRIVRQAHDSVRRMIVLDLEYGNTVDGTWVPGIQPRSKPCSIYVQGDDYMTLTVSSMPEEDEKTYDAVKRGLYAYLASKGLIGPGTLS